MGIQPFGLNPLDTTWQKTGFALPILVFVFALHYALRHYTWTVAWIHFLGTHGVHHRV